MSSFLPPNVITEFSDFGSVDGYERHSQRGGTFITNKSEIYVLTILFVSIIV